MKNTFEIVRIGKDYMVGYADNIDEHMKYVFQMDKVSEFVNGEKTYYVYSYHYTDDIILVKHIGNKVYMIFKNITENF